MLYILLYKKGIFVKNRVKKRLFVKNGGKNGVFSRVDFKTYPQVKHRIGNGGKSYGEIFKELKNQSRPKTVLMEMFSYIKIFSAAILIAFVLTRCVIVNAETPTSSMENTIMTGDRYFGLRISYLLKNHKDRILLFLNFRTMKAAYL